MSDKIPDNKKDQKPDNTILVLTEILSSEENYNAVLTQGIAGISRYHTVFRRLKEKEIQPMREMHRKYFQRNLEQSNEVRETIRELFGKYKIIPMLKPAEQSQLREQWNALNPEKQQEFILDVFSFFEKQMPAITRECLPGNSIINQWSIFKRNHPKHDPVFSSTVDSQLISPIQRGPRYELLLKTTIETIKKAEKNKDIIEKLKIPLQKISSSLKKMNEELMYRNWVDRALDVNPKIVFKGFSPNFNLKPFEKVLHKNNIDYSVRNKNEIHIKDKSGFELIKITREKWGGIVFSLGNIFNDAARQDAIDQMARVANLFRRLDVNKPYVIRGGGPIIKEVAKQKNLSENERQQFNKYASELNMTLKDKMKKPPVPPRPKQEAILELKKLLEKKPSVRERVEQQASKKPPVPGPGHS